VGVILTHVLGQLHRPLPEPPVHRQRRLHVLAQEALSLIRELGRRCTQYPLCQTRPSRLLSCLFISSSIPLQHHRYRDSSITSTSRCNQGRVGGGSLGSPARGIAPLLLLQPRPHPDLLALPPDSASRPSSERDDRSSDADGTAPLSPTHFPPIQLLDPGQRLGLYLKRSVA
jgi:hypothetical protein